MKIDRDAWLAEIFGHEVFKITVEPDRPGAPDLRETIAKHQLARMNDAVAEQPLFYYARVRTDRVDVVRDLTQSGFAVVDVNLTFECRPSAPARKTIGEPVAVREIFPEEHQAALRIAESCFAYSRFHLDPEITVGLAAAVKRAWVQSYLEDKRGEKLLVALRDGRAAGFLAVLAPKSVRGYYRVIDLIGVDRRHQGWGVGTALMRHLMNEAASVGGLLRVGTQAANVPSIRLYESLGFHVVETAYVLHAHVKPARCLG